MEKESKEFLYNLLTTPSPTGFEQPVQRIVRARMKKYADSVETDLHGNVIVGFNTKAKRRVLLAGHCDQIGFMVKHITPEGFIYISGLGGIDSGVLPGAAVTIHSNGKQIHGVVGRKPIHHQTGEERANMKLDIEKIWIDIGAKNKKEVEKVVDIGDPITFRLGVTELGKDLISSPGLDDKVGLFIAMEALRLVSTATKLNVAVFAVSTVQEEVGLRGAHTATYSVDPEVGIAIDVVAASDNPGNENGKMVPMKLGAGPAVERGPNINPVVEKLLFAAAKKAKVPHQPLAQSRLLGNDANAIQITKGGVATAAIGVPNRYMHTQAEICSLQDLENSARLLAEFLKSISLKTDFRPQ